MQTLSSQLIIGCVDCFSLPQFMVCFSPQVRIGVLKHLADFIKVRDTARSSTVHHMRHDLISAQASLTFRGRGQTPSRSLSVGKDKWG